MLIAIVTSGTLVITPILGGYVTHSTPSYVHLYSS